MQEAFKFQTLTGSQKATPGSCVIYAGWQESPGKSMFAVVSNQKPQPKSALRLIGRTGAVINEFQLDGVCQSLQWSAGDSVGILAVPLDNGRIFLWNPATSQDFYLDTNWKGSPLIKWSLKSQLLAVGSTKGNLLIFNPAISKKIPILGKTSKAITSLEWLVDARGDNLLAIGSEDRSFSLNKSNGETVRQETLEGEVTLIRAYVRKNMDEDCDERVVSCVVSGKTIRIYHLDETRAPVEFSMNAKYGSIVSCDWYDDDKLIVAFSNGYLIGLSTYFTPGKEVFHVRDSKEKIQDVCVCVAAQKVAVLSEAKLQIRELGDPKEVASIVLFEQERNFADKTQWSPDGQLVSVTSKTGMVYAFLDKMPQMAQTKDSVIAYLSHLTQITVFDFGHLEVKHTDVANLDVADFKIIQLQSEPSQITVGDRTVAVATSNRVEVHRVDGSEEAELMFEQTYPNTVKAIALNSLALYALVDDNVFVRHLEGDEQQVKLECDAVSNFSFLTTSRDFIVTLSATVPESIYHFLPELSLANEFKHDRLVKAIFPEPDGVLVAFLDDLNHCYVMNPVDGQVSRIDLKISRIDTILWDTKPRSDRALIALFDNQRLHVVALFYGVMKGPTWALVSEVEFGNTGLLPISFRDCAVICQSKSQKLVGFQIDFDCSNKTDYETLLKIYYSGSLSVLWKVLGNQDIPVETWNKIAEAALNILDIASAKRIYREKRIYSSAIVLDNLRYLDERNLICGHVSAMLKDYDSAQQFYLNSSNPKEALHLRKDLQQLDIALKLAESIAPEEKPNLFLQYAQQQEQMGNYQAAFDSYKKALDGLKQANLVEMAEGGFCRMTLRQGDISRGMRLLQKVKDPKVFGDCAAILEGLKQVHEAAMTYEKGSLYDKAAELYAKVKNFKKVGELLQHVKSTNTFLLYAKYQESEGNFQDAVKAYEKANDFENICRVNIECLQKVDEAVRVARQSRSKEAAKAVLKFFQKLQDYKSIVEFCVLAGLDEEAFSYAQTHGHMDVYASMLDESSSEKLIDMAKYFEQRDEYASAGKYYLKCRAFDKALTLLLKAPKSDSLAVGLAMDVVKQAKSEVLTARLIEALQSDLQNAKLLVTLYTNLEKYPEAIETALAISKIDQGVGNYKQARDILRDCVLSLASVNVPTPHALHEAFTIIHSYMLVKVLVKVEDHETAGRMLLRICKTISSFPHHIVPILTSAVIECHRSGLKKSAFEYAAMLCRPEYRSQIDEKFRRKIELAVRRPENEEKPESSSACPHCERLIPESSLVCNSCSKYIPFCVASGLHMTLDKWSCCPRCKFPVLQDRFKTVLEKIGTCPMCESAVDPEEVRLLDGKKELKKFSIKSPSE